MFTKLDRRCVCSLFLNAACSIHLNAGCSIHLARTAAHMRVQRLRSSSQPTTHPHLQSSTTPPPGSALQPGATDIHIKKKSWDPHKIS